MVQPSGKTSTDVEAAGYLQWQKPQKKT